MVFLQKVDNFSMQLLSTFCLWITKVNRYYRDEFQRIDANLVVRLCEYLDCDVSELRELKDREENGE